MLKKIISHVKRTVKKINKKSEPSGLPEPVRTASEDAVRPHKKSDEWVPGRKRTGDAPRAPAKSPPRQDAEAEKSDESSRPPRRRRRRRSGQDKSQATASDSSGMPSARVPTPPPVRDLPTHRPKNIVAFDGQSMFAKMEIPPSIKQALDEMHFKVTTPIQAALLPIALAGRDAAGKAQTGTGKTAAFLITIFAHFLRKPMEGTRAHGTPRALILAPTRELAMQIKQDAMDIGRHAGLHTVAVYGGMDFDKQQRELEQPVDIIVATPGRLMDFVNRKVINLKHVEVLVIDEADRMLDMGFIPDVRKIVRMTPHPEQRQTLLFSATLTPDIMRLAAQWTREAETVEIEPERIAAESVNQRVFITTQDEKFRLLYNLLCRENPERVLIFSNRRDQAEMLHDHLKSYGFSTALLSGAVEQKKRIRVLDDFKAGNVRVLVATDVAGRGLHVEGISHVINYHMPMDADDYVHRIGRTGRAGEIGTSISFACELDSFAIPDIEKFIGHPLVCEHPTDELLAPLPSPQYRVESKPRRAASPGGRGRSVGGRGGSGGGMRGGSGGGRGGRSSGRGHR